MTSNVAHIHTATNVPCRFKDERRRRGTVRSNYDSARKKCVFGSAVYDKLVAVFERNRRPDLATRKALAVKAGASETQINSW